MLYLYIVVISVVQVCLSEPAREEVEKYQRELEARGRENMVLYHRCQECAGTVLARLLGLLCARVSVGVCV